MTGISLQKVNRIIIFMVMCIPLVSVQALNPIHNASYDNSHFTHAPENNYFQGSLFFSPHANQKIRFPFSLGLKLMDEWEVGGGIKSRWLDEVNNVQHLVMGTRVTYIENLALGLDFLWGTASAAGDGFAVSGWYHTEFSDMLYGNALGRVGFFDALVWADEGWMAFEAGYYAGAKLHETFSLEVGAFGFSQVGDFSDYFGIDIEPLVVIQPGEEFKMTGGVIFGVAGDRKTRLRIEGIVWYDI